jgi:hypothetical protein
MKKVFLALTIISGVAFSACENDELNPEYPFTIIVKTISDSTVVQNVLVEAAAPVPGNKVWLSGNSDTEGKVSLEYDQAATLSIRASRGQRPEYTWIGCT